MPEGTLIKADAGIIDFPPDSFTAVVTFYTLEHIPRVEHLAGLRRNHKKVRTGGFLIISIETGDYHDQMGEWLGVPMFIFCYDPETMKQLVSEAGFELLETASEIQL